jgi:Na+-driven multidrug efflux pump
MWGILGIAVATAISLIVQNILMIINAKRKVGIWTYMKLSLKEIRVFQT